MTVIYIVEDDSNIRQMESYALKNSGYEVAECSDGTGFWILCGTVLPDLVVLDIMLPGEDVLSILRRLRDNPATRRIPVIIVSAKSTELDTVTGLDTGADDYITKPFGVMELISRVKAMFRRMDVRSGSQIALGSLLLDDDKRQVFADGVLCPLTYKEHELLKYLLLNQEIVLTREKMMDKVWGTDFAGESRTVDMHIKTLRQKLGSCGNMIKTVRNVGYKIEV
jgi:two-component system alkaline phosphatase synthesis response regulator PhoP